MKRITFVFSTVSHGTTADREGLDTLLATSALADDLAVFFIVDGAFQLLSGQRPGAVLARDYIAIFRLPGPYNIGQCWVCAASLRECGLDPWASSVVEATSLEVDALCREFANYDVALRLWGVILYTLYRSPWLTDFAALLCLLSESDELLLL